MPGPGSQCHVSGTLAGSGMDRCGKYRLSYFTNDRNKPATHVVINNNESCANTGLSASRDCLKVLFKCRKMQIVVEYIISLLFAVGSDRVSECSVRVKSGYLPV